MNASTPWCIHSYLNGVPLFDAANPANAAALLNPNGGEGAALPEAAAPDASAQPVLPALGGVVPQQ